MHPITEYISSSLYFSKLTEVILVEQSELDQKNLNLPNTISKVL